MLRRGLTIVLLLMITFKGPLFGIYFPGTYENNNYEVVKQFEWDPYECKFERITQPGGNDLYNWRCKDHKFFKILYQYTSIAYQAQPSNDCQFEITFDSGPQLMYDTCLNKLDVHTPQ